ncbi:hypothetical protein HPP92_028048, partial [Vanilla planifolia]
EVPSTSTAIGEVGSKVLRQFLQRRMDDVVDLTGDEGVLKSIIQRAKPSAEGPTDGLLVD